jgi:GAF domain-containing protein
MSTTIFPLLIAYTLSFFISATVAVIGWRRRTIPGAFPLFVFAISEASWTFGLIAETSISTLSGKIFWDNFQFIGWLAATAATIPFALEFSGRYQQTPRKIWTGLMLVPTLAGILAYTDPIHKLIRSSAELVEGGGLISLYYPFSNVFLAMALFTYAATIIALVIVVIKIFKSRGDERAQAIFVSLGILIPIVGGILSIAEMLPEYIRDISPFTFGLSNIILAYGLLQRHLFDLMPIARDRILDELSNGIILLNNKNLLAFVNPAARKFLNLQGQFLGQPAPKELAGWMEVHQNVELANAGLLEIHRNGENFAYEVDTHEIRDLRRNVIGRIILLTDITQQRSISEQLKERSLELEKQSAELQKVTQRAQRRASQLEAVSNVNRDIAAIQNPQEMLEAVTSAIGKHFGFYHVGLFLLDSRREYAILRAASSEGGKKLLSRGYRIKVGETGLAGFVSYTGRPRLILEQDDPSFLKIPEISETRTEVALPLVQNKETIGVLDLHSTEQDALTNEDISVLSLLADQVSIALQNANLFEESRKATAETQMLLQQFGQSQWGRITSEKKLIGFRYDGSAIERLGENIPMPKHGISTGSDNEQTLAVPIKVRGQVIGSLGIRAPKGHRWTPDEIDIINAVSERMAISAENARLLQDSQDRAAKEQTISNVSAKIGASFNMDSILRTAVEELGQIIPGSEVAIQLKRRDAQDKDNA